MESNLLARMARFCEFLLGALFLSAAVLKLANIPLFAGQIQSYGVISAGWIPPVAELLVPLETMLGVAMLAGLRLRGYVLYVSIGMLIFFSLLVAYAWPENCGCFGPIKMGPEETLTKNLVMFLMAVLGILALRKPGMDDPHFGAFGKGLVTLLMGALALYFTHDQFQDPDKYFKATPQKAAPAPAAPQAATASTPAPTPTPTPATTPAPAPTPTPDAAAPPAPAPASADAHDHEAEHDHPSAPTSTEVYPADAKPIFQGYTLTAQDGSPLDLGAGTYLVAILNATCDHCMATVPAINDLAVRPDLPTVVGLVQEPEPGSLDTFVVQTGTAFPVLSMGNDFIKFSEFVKTAPPRFTLVRDGKPLQSWEEYPPSAEDLQAAAAKP